MQHSPLPGYHKTSCFANEPGRGFFIYKLIELLPKGVLQLHLATLNHVLTQMEFLSVCFSKYQ